MKNLTPEDYLENKITCIIEPMLTTCAIEQPDNVILFMIDWLKNLEGKSTNSANSELMELKSLRREIGKYKKKFANEDHELLPDTPVDSEDDEEKDKVDAMFEEKQKLKMTQGARTSVSAEVYGKYYKKENFVPKIIKKNANQLKRIQEKVIQSFLFNSLEEKDLKTVIDAMEEKKCKSGEYVIKQKEKGDVLYVIESGTLDCYKTFKEEEGDKYLKTYGPGDSFGELALLYNAPRAASVKAKTDCVLWTLDRETFNNIVKESAMKKREKYESVLSKVEILKTIDPYELGQIADAVKVESFKKNEYIIKQNDNGDKFYIILEGEAYATKVFTPGESAKKVLDYTKGSFFGELALIKNEPRAASVIAKNDCKLITMDRSSFKRLLGPIESLLKRNSESYVKFIGK